MKFILICACGPLEGFRGPELDSIAQLYNFKISYSEPQYQDPSRPYIIIEVESEVQARLIGERAISVKSIWEWWGDARTYEELHDSLKERESVYSSFVDISPWRFELLSYARAVSLVEQVKVFDSFSYMAFTGKIDFKNPALHLGIMEEFGTDVKGVSKSVHDDLRGDRLGGDLKWIFLGRKICDSARHMIETYDLKKRAYIGTTSMEAEVSLMMSNQALAGPGKLVYDPFAGTGSMLVTCAAFGAVAFGSDIDGRQLRGKTTSIASNAAQYGVEDKILDTAAFDLTQHPFRSGNFFDAIVTDPPYGVRAGAKRLGRKNVDPALYVPFIIPGRESEGPTHAFPDYIPPQMPWEMTEVINSLCTFALYLLKPNGRLVFFLPTDNEDYRDVDIPCIAGLTLISNTLQDYGKWGRRLITMEKVGEGKEEIWDRGIDRLSLGAEPVAKDQREGHFDFRARYANSFKKS